MQTKYKLTDSKSLSLMIFLSSHENSSRVHFFCLVSRLLYHGITLVTVVSFLSNLIFIVSDSIVQY